MDPDEAEDKVSDSAANEAENDISNDRAFAVHELSCDPSGDSADDKCNNYSEHMNSLQFKEYRYSILQKRRSGAVFLSLIFAGQILRIASVIFAIIGFSHGRIAMLICEY